MPGGIASAFEGLGFRPRAPVALVQFADTQTRDSWIRDKGLTVFSLWSSQHPGFELDLFVREPFEFDRVYETAVEVRLTALGSRVWLANTESAVLAFLPSSSRCGVASFVPNGRAAQNR